MSTGKYSNDIKKILDNKNKWDFSLENVIKKIGENQGSVSIKGTGTDRQGVTCNIRNKIVGKEIGAQPIIGDTKEKDYKQCDTSSNPIDLNKSLVCDSTCLQGSGENTQWSEAGEYARIDYKENRENMATNFGSFIHTASNKNIERMKKIEDYLLGNNDKPKEFGGISKNTFTPTYIPCLVQSDYTNKTMPDTNNLPYRYNYNIVESEANSGMFKNLENNLTSSEKFKKTTYNYEKYYEFYNEIVLINPENIDATNVDYSSYFGNNDLLKIGSEAKKGFINSNDSNSVVYINANINEHILNNGYQDWTLKTLKNLSNHRWDLFVRKKLFTEEDLNSQKKFRLLGYKNNGRIGFLIYKDGQIDEVEPVGNVVVNKHANAFGTFRYYVPSIQKTVNCTYLHKYAVLDNILIDENKFIIKKDEAYGFVNPNGGDIKFKNTSVTYNKWLNSPDKIIMTLKSISEPLFVKTYTNQQIKINSKGQITDIFPFEMFSQNNIDSENSNVTNNTNKIIINIKWGKRPSVYGKVKILKYIENRKDGIVELDDGSWFYNPGRIDLYVEFNNIFSETNSMFDINNIFDEKSKQCKQISLPTPSGCQRKPILLRDYNYIKNHHPTLFADCGNGDNIGNLKEIRKKILDNCTRMDSSPADGKVDENEFDRAIATQSDLSDKQKSDSKDNFFKMDSNGDNAVTKDEINTYFDELESKEGFINEINNYSKTVQLSLMKQKQKLKDINSIYIFSIGLLFMYLLYKLKNKY